MFGDILIDKLRISLKLTNGFNPRSAKIKLDNIMSKHFRKNNYTVNYDKRYFRVTFTPTLYLDEVVEKEGKIVPIFNLQMPEQSKFLSLLKQIYNVLGDNAIITWVDITKNITTLSKVEEYIQTLLKCKPKYPYNKAEYTSRRNNVTLTLSPRKRKNVVNCKNSNRQITFYSKISEIKTKTTGKARFIENVRLSEKEIELLSKEGYQDRYDAEKGRLFFDTLNLLRCEQRYRYSNNIKRIVYVLTNSRNENKLNLQLFINLLENNELYSKLDEFYTNELRQYIFYHDIEGEEDIKLNKYEEIVKDYVKEYDIDITNFQYLFEELELKDKFIYSMRKVFYHTISDYYRELYKKYQI